MRHFGLVILFGVLALRALDAQITRENYYSHLPPMPRLVAQTEASAQFKLYGDEHSELYADADSNGIEDARQKQLARIADRFSPILRRNNFSFPRNFKRAAGNQDVLVVDLWRAGRLVSSEQVPLGWSAGAKSSTDAEASRNLAGIVEWSDPMRPEPRFTRPDDYDDRVLYVDFPGRNPVTWREAYRNADPAEATVYTHFFIYRDTASRSERMYQLVAQHWFFYPFNDSGNNHEGDWEHMNVRLATRASARADAAGRMTERDVRYILAGGSEVIDSLMIAAVDYYFHESVLTVDYLGARIQRDTSAGWLERLNVWQDSGYISRAIDSRLTVANGALATHPVGYIGGDNMGPDELLSWKPRLAGGAYNRNGHGTYPFPGTWQGVGPLGSTERILGDVVPKVRANAHAQTPLLDLLSDTQFVVFASENIILVPDWEQIHSLIMTSVTVQNEWAWLVLPMRWGFPASKSPGAGAVPHTDLGNIAPETPTYQPTWNRVGVAGSWHNYEPQVLRVLLAPTKPWNRLRNGVGLLNIPVGLIGFLPGWNVAVTQLMPWLSGTLHLVGMAPARTFTPPATNLRFSSVTAGPLRQFGGSEFAMLLPGDSSDAYAPELLTRNLHTSSSSRSARPTTANRFGIEVHYGPRLSIENTYASGSRIIRSVVTDEDDRFAASVQGTLHARDLTGGARYDLLQTRDGRAQLFTRAGYGWTWYSVDNVTINGTESNYIKKGGYGTTLLPSRRWWPNTWYGGAGVELFARHQGWFMPQVGYGLRAEATASRHRLGATRPGDSNLGVVSRGEVAVSLVIGW